MAADYNGSRLKWQQIKMETNYNGSRLISQQIKMATY
jgi:hypothetical protein